MIQAYSNNGLILGLTRGNIDRLLAGKPIHLDIPEHLTVTHVGILFGEDKPAILRELEEAGAEIPQAMKETAASDPE